MTKLQFIALLSPSLGSLVLVVLAWMHQNQRLTDLRTDSNRQFDEVKGALLTLASDYRHFYGMEQKLEGRVDELSKRVA